MKKAYMILGTVSTLLFVLLIILLKTVDVSVVGATSTEIGLSAFNNALALPVNENIDKLSDLFLCVAIFEAVSLMAVGVVQLFKGKSFKKVDKGVIFAGVAFVVLMLAYVFFEVFIINYRGFLVEGEIEASFPSSHTMIFFVITGIFTDYCAHKFKFKKLISFVGALLIVLSTVLRVFSGMHWITDIIGAVLLSIAIIAFYKGILIKTEGKK